MKTKIYIYTFDSGFRTDRLDEALIRKNEEVLLIANHMSSCDEWARHDMITSGWKDEIYDEICGEGNWEIVDDWTGI